MSLVTRLLKFLPSYFSRDPEKALALRLQVVTGSMTWSVADGVLTATPSGGSTASALSVDLSDYTIKELGLYLVQQAGYEVPYCLNSSLSALCLLEGSGDQADSNGDHIYMYGSILYALLDTIGAELVSARAAIVSMLEQTSLSTASGGWIDEHGYYYNVDREDNETDDLYAARIIAEVLCARGNGVAMEAAISALCGGLAVSITDAAVTSAGALFNGDVDFDGSKTYNSAGTNMYGLFDVAVEQPLDGAMSLEQFRVYVQKVVNRMRMAGTFMRQITWSFNIPGDSVTAPTDSWQDLAYKVGLQDSVATPTETVSGLPVLLARMADAADAAQDSLTLTVVYVPVYDGSRVYDGSVAFGGTVVETL